MVLELTLIITNDYKVEPGCGHCIYCFIFTTLFLFDFVESRLYLKFNVAQSSSAAK